MSNSSAPPPRRLVFHVIPTTREKEKPRRCHRCSLSLFNFALLLDDLFFRFARHLLNSRRSLVHVYALRSLNFHSDQHCDLHRPAQARSATFRSHVDLRKLRYPPASLLMSTPVVYFFIHCVLCHGRCASVMARHYSPPTRRQWTTSAAPDAQLWTVRCLMKTGGG